MRAADTVQDVEEQGFEQRGIGAHRLEVEHLESLDVECVIRVVEEVGVASALDPLRRAGQRGRVEAGSPG